MEEMRKVALAYYANSSSEFKRKARDTFDNIDNDRDGRISKYEFIEFWRANGKNSRRNDRKLFAELDRKRDGYLNFEEAIVFFYIGNFARFWCDKCRRHLTRTYFTCPDCSLDKQCYDLCAACYGGKDFDHEHRTFVDNHVMLSVVRKELQKQLSKKEYNPPGTQRYERGRTPDRQLQTRRSNGRLRKLDIVALAIQQFGPFVQVCAAIANASCSIM